MVTEHREQTTTTFIYFCWAKVKSQKTSFLSVKMIFPALGVNRKVVDIDKIYLNMQNEQNC